MIGTVGWVASRLIGSRNANIHGNIPVSREKAAVGMSAIQAKEPTRRIPESAAQRQPQEEHRPDKVDLKEPQPGQALENQPEKLSIFFILLLPFLILPVVIVLFAFRHIPVQSQVIVPGGDPNRGQAALQVWGCGACHTIEGVTGANGVVGPALNRESERSYIAGHLRNTPDNMIRWIAHPQEVSPGVDMPDSGVPEAVARDMAAYLYSIR